MSEILTWAIATSIALLISILVFFIGVFYRKLNAILISIATLLMGIGFAGRTVYLVAKKTDKTLTGVFKPRTGSDIYEALWGKSAYDCIKVLDYQDQYIPVIDYAIWLHFATCPDELRRIAGQHPYSYKIVSTKGLTSDGPLSNENWFQPEVLGDSMIIMTFENINTGNGQYIYCSLDSTEAFCIDIFD